MKMMAYGHHGQVGKVFYKLIQKNIWFHKIFISKWLILGLDLSVTYLTCPWNTLKHIHVIIHLNAMHLIIYRFKFLAQSIHMVLRYSHFCVITGIITYTVIRCKAFRTKTVLIKSLFRKIIWKKFIRFLIIYIFKFLDQWSWDIVILLLLSMQNPKQRFYKNRFEK